MSRQWFVIAPLPNVAARLTTVGPCQTRACCSMCTTPSERMSLAAKYPSSLLKVAPPANATPSQRLTVLPLASWVTKVASRDSLMRCASLSSISSQEISCHLSLPGPRYSGFVTRRLLIASCIAVAPFGQSRPSLTGLSGSPSIWRSFVCPLPSSLVNAMSEHPTAQYGHSECTSFAPSIRRFCWTWTASARSNPKGVVPSTPAPTAPSLTKSRRVIWGMVTFLLRIESGVGVAESRSNPGLDAEIRGWPSRQRRDARRQTMGARVEIEPTVPHEPDEGHVRGERHLDRHAGRRRDRGDHRDPGGQGLLHDLEAHAPADHQHVPVERHAAGQHHVADHLVHGVVTADVFAQHDQPAVGVEEPGGVQPARLLERRLGAVHRRRQVVEAVDGDHEVGLHRRERRANRVDGRFSAEAAGRGRHEVTTQAVLRDPRVALQQHVHHVAVVGISVGGAVPCDDIEIVGARDDAFREEEARDELLVVAGRAHGDAQAGAAETNLKGLFDGEVVLTFRGAVIPDFDNTMKNGGDASRDFQIRI